jgi:hypothetical protein
LPWLLLFVFVACLMMRRHFAGWSCWEIYLQGFTMLLISLWLQSLPFVLLACLLSAFMQSYLSGETLARLLPKRYFPALLAASLVGVCFPLSGSEAVPVAEGLVKRGVPVGVATTMLVAAPVVNPVVLVATYQAFDGSLPVVLLRLLCGLVLALGLGDLVGRRFRQQSPLLQVSFYQQKVQVRQRNWPGAHRSLLDVLQHTSDQLFQVERYLIPTTMLVAGLRVFTSVRWLPETVGPLALLTIPVALLLSFLCSVGGEADAFLLSALDGQLPGGALLGAMLLGPVLNLRSFHLLSMRFERSFVRVLYTLAGSFVLVVAILAYLARF